MVTRQMVHIVNKISRVEVRVMEPGQHKAAFKVNKLSVIIVQGHYLLFRTYCCYFTVCHSYRLTESESIIDSCYDAIMKYFLNITHFVYHQISVAS